MGFPSAEYAVYATLSTPGQSSVGTRESADEDGDGDGVVEDAVGLMVRDAELLLPPELLSEPLETPSSARWE